MKNIQIVDAQGNPIKSEKQVEEEKMMNKDLNLKDVMGLMMSVLGGEEVEPKEKKTFNFKEKATKVWDWVKDQSKRVYHYIKQNITTVAITTGSVIVSGAITTGVIPAIVMGAGLAAFIELMREYIKNKKVHVSFYKQALLILGIATTVPLALYLGSLLTLFVSVFGFVAPYSVVVA